MKLIANWKKAWRMLSVQAMALAGAVQGASVNCTIKEVALATEQNLLGVLRV